MAGFYEPLATNNGFSSDSDAAFRRDRLIKKITEKICFILYT